MSVPEEKKSYGTSCEPAMYSVDTEEHLHARGAGEGLADGEYLLILCADVSSVYLA